MKELSIEEKAKRYDEAIERGKQILNTPYTAHWDIMKEVAEHLLPSLKESEDERIMENIIATIHLYYGEPLEDEAKEMVAWLEKQGQTFTKKDVDDAYLKGVCDAKHEIEKQGKNNMGISEATKQKLEDNLHEALEKETPESCNEFLDEQKPAETEKGAKGNEREIPISAWSEEDEENLNWFEKFFRAESVIAEGKDIPQDRYLWFKNLKDRVQLQQQKWSKDDEKNLNEALSYIKDETLKNFIKDRVQLQPKQGWSKEDERMFKNTIALIETLEDYNKAPNGFGDVKFWLKSLKGRYTWRPSDEQIKVCKEVYADILSTKGFDLGTVNSELNRLEEELKKLREE